MENKIVNIIGAGLAGCECAYFLAEHNIQVHLYEMKNIKKNPAQKMDGLAELVCSNSLKSKNMFSASGLLKLELEMLDSLLIDCAKKSSVEAGESLSVDRNEFSDLITKKINEHKNIIMHNEIVESFDTSVPTVIAAGPLCDEKLFAFIQSLIGDENCYFYDAIAPIIETSSVDMNRAFWGNRYEKGETKDYLNCVLYKSEYEEFAKNLLTATTVELKNFEKLKVFEGCMPIEVLAKRGEASLRYGPMKPVGLCKQSVGEKPYAVVQLRKEDSKGEYVNMVGFQTNLLFGEQKRVFSLIPALKNANFVRYGTMHRNSYINAPLCLNKFAQLKKYPNIFVAGQISGVEGYVESIASGLYCGLNMLQYLQGKDIVGLDASTVIGALFNAITTASVQNFQPVNANYSIISCSETFAQKQDKREYITKNSLQKIEEYKQNILKSYKKFVF